MEHLADYFSLRDLAGHASYVLLAISYYATSIYWLRVMAVLGLVFEIAYFALSGGAMYTGIAWCVIFVLINVYQIHRLVRERMKLRGMTDVALLRQGAFAGLDDAQLSRLVTVGHWRDAETGARLTQQGQPVAELMLLCAGSARVEVDDRAVAQLHPGTLCGEMAFLSGEPASATVIVGKSVRAFVFDMPKLRALVESDKVVASSINLVVGRDLMQKVNRKNSAGTPSGEAVS
jgi:hypothetical protein